MGSREKKVMGKKSVPNMMVKKMHRMTWRASATPSPVMRKMHAKLKKRCPSRGQGTLQIPPPRSTTSIVRVDICPIAHGVQFA